MAAVTRPFATFDNRGTPLEIDMTYDDVTLKVASFSWNNTGPATQVVVTVNGVASQPQNVPVGPGQYVPGGAGVTLLPSLKPGGGPRFPFSVSIAPV